MVEFIDIKQVEENEFLIGENRIIVIDNEIIYVEAVGEQTPEIADAIRGQYKKIMSRFPGKVHQLINLNRAGKNSPEARKLWEEINEYVFTGKVAVFGVHPVAKVLASFVIGVTNKKDIRFFSTEKEALAWLKA